MLYLANPSTPAIREAMAAGKLGAVMSFTQGNRLPADTLFMVDNNCGPVRKGKPGDAYPGAEWYLGMLQDLWNQGGGEFTDPDTSRALFAVAPDRLADARGTIHDSQYMLPWIREVGFPAAFVIQDGIEREQVPWDDFDVLFIGGTTAFKLGPVARQLCYEALSRWKRVHMGRVNSLRRLRYAASIGCDTVDGTYLTYGPDVNLARLLRWLDDVNSQGAMFEGAN